MKKRKFKPILLLQKKPGDLTNREQHWLSLVMNQAGYRVDRDIVTEEIFVWKTRPYEEDFTVSIKDI